MPWGWVPRRVPSAWVHCGRVVVGCRAWMTWLCWWSRARSGSGWRAHSAWSVWPPTLWSRPTTLAAAAAADRVASPWTGHCGIETEKLWQELPRTNNTWAAWPLKSPATQLFSQQFVWTSIKENVEAMHYWPFVRGIRGYSPQKGPVMQKVFSCHDVFMKMVPIFISPGCNLDSDMVAILSSCQHYVHHIQWKHIAVPINLRGAHMDWHHLLPTVALK